MLLVKTTIGPSPIHGIGVFAAEAIPKGTVMWRLERGFDLELTQEQVDRLSPPAREKTLHYAYKDPRTDLYVLCMDDARFYNYSEAANSAKDPAEPERDIALRDIRPGEEITYDYGSFDTDFEREPFVRRA
jgi:SET domain-containing protein